MIKALVIDDELPARENLKILIEDYCEGIEVIATVGTIQAAKTLIIDQKPDVIFLDIRMPSGAEGFDLLDSLEVIDFEIVFVTAFKDYAIQAFKANALDYVLKPVEIDELILTAKKIVTHCQSQQKGNNDNKSVVTNALNTINNQKIERIAITHSKGLKLIEVKDIVRLQSHSNYTEIHFKDGSKFMDSKTLKTYQEILSTDEFMRLHNSHIVRLSEISEYHNEQGNIVVLKNKDQIPVSRANINNLMAFFKTV
jgi:two-component system LytT family response regulator